MIPPNLTDACYDAAGRGPPVVELGCATPDQTLIASCQTSRHVRKTLSLTTPNGTGHVTRQYGSPACAGQAGRGSPVVELFATPDQTLIALCQTCGWAPRHAYCPPLARLPQKCRVKHEHEAWALSPEAPSCSTIPPTLTGACYDASGLGSPAVGLGCATPDQTSTCHCGLWFGMRAVPRDGAPTSRAAARQAAPPAGRQVERPARFRPALGSLHASGSGSGRDESGDSVAWGCDAEEKAFALMAAAMMSVVLMSAALVAVATLRCRGCRRTAAASISCPP